MILLISLLIVLPRPSLADCAAEAAACKEYVLTLEKQVQIQDSVIDKMRKQNKDLTKRLAESNNDPAIPGWAWGIIGVAAGVTAAGLLHK